MKGVPPSCLLALLVAGAVGAAVLPLPPAAAATALLQVAANPVPASGSLPGTSGSIAFAMENVGDAAAFRIHAVLAEVQGGLVVNDTELELGALGAGEKTTVSPVSFEVPHGTPPGFYHLSYRFDYFFNDGGQKQGGGFSATATVAVRASPSVEVRAIAPEHVDSGEVVAANLTVTNDGPADFASLVLQWSSPDGSLLPSSHGTTWRFPRIGANSSVQVPVWFSTAPGLAPGTYVMHTLLGYVDATGAPLNSTSNVGIRVGDDLNGPAANQLRVTVTNVTDDSVTIAVTNTMPTPVTGVEVRLLDGPGIERTDADAAVVALIAPGDFAKATFAVARKGDAAPEAVVQVLFTDSQGVQHHEGTKADLSGVAVPYSRTTVVGFTVAAVLGGEAALALVLVVALRGRRRRRAERRQRAQDDEAFMQGPGGPGGPGPGGSGGSGGAGSGGSGGDGGDRPPPGG